jgi:hypothetical protein
MRLAVLVILLGIAAAPAAFGQAVVLSTDTQGRWTLIDPAGQRVDVAASRTGGFQEAVDESVRRRTTLRMTGGPSCRMLWHETVRVPPLTNNTHWDIEPCDIRFIGSGDAIVFDTMIHANIRWRAHLFHEGGGAVQPAVVRFDPRGVVDDWGPFMIDSRIEWFRASFLGRGFGIGMRLSARQGVIIHNSIEIVEIEGRSGMNVYLGDGVLIDHPGPGQTFSGNSISVQRLQGFMGAGFRVGEDVQPAGAGPIDSNRFSAHIVPMSPTAVAFSSWGRHDLAQLHISNQIAPFGAGLRLFEGAGGGVYIAPRNDGRPRVEDRSRLRNSIFLTP